jgi:hypothetical protein
LRIGEGSTCPNPGGLLTDFISRPKNRMKKVFPDVNLTDAIFFPVKII